MIARGRSCTSVLVVPRTKPSLVDAFHGRRPLANLRASLPAMGSSPEGEERRGAGGTDGYGGEGRGRHGDAARRGRGAQPCTGVRELAAVLCWELLREEERKEERERERKKKEEKRMEKCGFFSNVIFLWRNIKYNLWDWSIIYSCKRSKYVEL
jgi:hypothetical protein